MTKDCKENSHLTIKRGDTFIPIIITSHYFGQEFIKWEKNINDLNNKTLFFLFLYQSIVLIFHLFERDFS